VKKPLDKVIPVRLPADKWEEIEQETRELGIGPATLASVRQRLKPTLLPNNWLIVGLKRGSSPLRWGSVDGTKNFQSSF